MVALPLVGGAVGARGEESVEDRQKDRALDGKAELAPAKFVFDHAAEAEVLPQFFEDERGADSPHGSGAEAPGAMALDDADLLREAGEGLRERVEVAMGFEAVEAPQRGDDALPGLPAVAPVLDDLKVAARAGRLDADEHWRAPLGTPPY